jgi:hypothetical protein
VHFQKPLTCAAAGSQPNEPPSTDRVNPTFWRKPFAMGQSYLLLAFRSNLASSCKLISL